MYTSLASAQLVGQGSTIVRGDNLLRCLSNRARLNVVATRASNPQLAQKTSSSAKAPTHPFNQWAAQQSGNSKMRLIGTGIAANIIMPIHSHILPACQHAFPNMHMLAWQSHGLVLACTWHQLLSGLCTWHSLC